MTDYAEGLACHNFDRKIHYTKRCVSFNKWLVVDSNLFNDNYHQEVNPDSFIDPIKFMREREVTITDDSFMNWVHTRKGHKRKTKEQVCLLVAV